MNKGFIKLGVLAATLFVAIVGVLAFSHVQNVQATFKHNVWQTTYGEWSQCTPDEGNQCGENNGHKTRTVTKTCVETNGAGQDECKIDKTWVPAVYDCEIFETINDHSYNVSQFYNKPTGDDNHCHRINWGDLSVDQQNAFKAMHGNSVGTHGTWTSAYNFHIDQNPNAHVVTAGHWEYQPETQNTTETEPCEIPQEQVIACEDTRVHVCNDPEATNFDASVDEEKEVADRGVCEYPTPTPSEQGNPPTFAGSSTEAPVCTTGETLQLPANLHVVRGVNGDFSKAVVNFFITQGDSANIYWQTSGLSNWDHPAGAAGDVKPNSDNFVSYTVNDLDPNGDYDFAVEQKFGCGTGQKAKAVVIDAAVAKTFKFSFWIW